MRVSRASDGPIDDDGNLLKKTARHDGLGVDVWRDQYGTFGNPDDFMVKRQWEPGTWYPVAVAEARERVIAMCRVGNLAAMQRALVALDALEAQDDTDA